MFRVLGSTTEPIPQAPDAPLTIYGQYVDSELPQLIAAEKPDVLLFAAQVPETYAYTLSVALQSGLADRRVRAGRVSGAPRRRAALDDGALERAAGQVERGAAGGIRHPAARAGRAGGGAVQGGRLMDAARYRTLYLAPMPAGPRTRGLPDALPAFDDRHFFLRKAKSRSCRCRCRSSSPPVSNAATRLRAWS